MGTQIFRQESRRAAAGQQPGSSRTGSIINGLRDMTVCTEPDDFVIATGQYHSVREFCTLAFKEVGIELRWEGEGVDEKGIDVATGRTLVEVDPKYFRPAEVDQLLGDPTKARTVLGWNPRKTSFEDLVKIMVKHDMKKVRKLYLRSKLDDGEE